MANTTQMDRLIYLSASSGVTIPNNLLQLVHRGVTLNQISKYGIIHTENSLDIKTGLLQEKYKRGETLGVGTPVEYRKIIGDNMLDSLKSLDITSDEFLTLSVAIHQFANTNKNDVLGELSSSLDDLGGASEIPKFVTGLLPLDLVLGGLYQSIVTLAMKTGDGKTTFSVLLMCMLRKYNIVDEIWYFNAEIPHPLMQSKIKMGKDKLDVKFKPTDVLFSGSDRAIDILRRIEENPNQSRAIFYDGPDVTVSGDGDGKISGIEADYLTLVKIKRLSKFIVVTSQVPRPAKWPFNVSDLSDSSSKEKYSDVVLFGRKKSNFENDGENNENWGRYSGAQLLVAKNRFGAPNKILNYMQDYVGLTSEVSNHNLTNFFEDFGPAPEFVLDYYEDFISPDVMPWNRE